MKKIKKIFSIVFPLMLLSVNSYSVESITENLTGNVKYAGIIIAVAIISLIIFLGYKSDKRREERPAKKNDNPYNNFNTYNDIEEEDSSAGKKLFNEEVDEPNIQEQSDVRTSELDFQKNDESMLEEESLYNSVNEYVEERKKEEDLILEQLDDNIDLNSEEEVYEEIEEYTDAEKYDDDVYDDIEEYEDDVYEKAEEYNEEEYEEVEEDKEEISDFTFDTAPEYNEETLLKFGSEQEVQNESLDFEYENNVEDEKELAFESGDDEEIKQENKNSENTVKKYTGKKLDKKVNLGIIQDMGLDFEEIIEEDEDDEDIGVPTFDELLKQSEQEEALESKEFDFMLEMEENLKKNKEAKVAKKSETKKTTAKKNETSKKATTKKGETKKTTAAKKTTTKKSETKKKAATKKTTTKKKSE